MSALNDEAREAEEIKKIDTAETEKIEKYMREKGMDMPRRPLDAIQGLYYAQGDMILHITFAIVAYFVRKNMDPEMLKNVDDDCRELDGEHKHGYQLVDDALYYLFFMHTFCFGMLSLGEMLKSRAMYIRSYTEVVTVPVYQIIILIAYERMKRTEKIMMDSAKCKADVAYYAD